MGACSLSIAVCCVSLVSALQAQPQTPYQSAVAHVQQAHPELAIPILQDLLARSPGDLKARNLLGIAMLNSGRQEEAAKQWTLALELDRTFYPALKNLAIAELALGRRADARSHFEQVLKLAPDDAVSHLNLAEIEYADGRFKPSAAHYRLSGGLPLKDSQTALRAARAYVNSGNPSDTRHAYDALRAATQLEPANEAIYLDLISLCVDHHTWDLALQVADAALDRLPQSFRVRLQRGAVLALKGETAAAEQEFAVAARVAPEQPVAHVTLALVWIQLNRTAEAIELLRDTRTRHPKDYLVTWILGETLAQQDGSDEEAIQALDDAARLSPREAAPKILLGKLLARQGDLVRAARELEAAVKIEPADTGALYQLATIYRKTGNTKRADELFEKVAKARKAPDDSNRPNLEQIIRRAGR